MALPTRENITSSEQKIAPATFREVVNISFVFRIKLNLFAQAPHKLFRLYSA
jgi:hypothetical protein